VFFSRILLIIFVVVEVFIPSTHRSTSSEHSSGDVNLIDALRLYIWLIDVLQ
jgi:hypothetical protein